MNRYLKTKKVSERLRNWSVFISIIVVGGSGLLADEWAIRKYGTTIGGFFENVDYYEFYYVNVFENERTTKNYQLPGLIYRNTEYGEYELIEFEWPNGGYIQLYDRSYDQPLVPGDKVKVVDNKDKTWYVQLTTIKAPIPDNWEGRWKGINLQH